MDGLLLFVVGSLPSHQAGHLQRYMANAVARFGSVFLRLTLGAAFLSAVADRFGLWGARGEPSVAWGDFDRFVAYTGTINPYAPDALVPVLAWTATLAEVALGVALILGLFTRTAAWLSCVLLLLFGLGMTMGTGLKSALDASVLSAAAGAFALSVLGPYPWSLDAARGRSGLDAVP